MKLRLLFLTNPENDALEEDELVERVLKRNFDLIVSHPLDCLHFLAEVDGVVIRNIWPTHEYQEQWEWVKECLRESDLPIYNPLTLKGDIEGKDYLVTLYKQRYPVIPSIDDLRQIDKLPDTNDYWIKPKKSCDGVGAKRVTKDVLLRLELKDYVIQPFVEFQYEPSFFYIDNRFQHAISAKHRLWQDRTSSYQAHSNDLAFAAKFVRWADVPYGTLRVDAVRLNDGRLLLTEIENLCPYLYLPEVGQSTRQDFLNAFAGSVIRALSKTQPEEAAVEHNNELLTK